MIEPATRKFMQVTLLHDREYKKQGLGIYCFFSASDMVDCYTSEYFTTDVLQRLQYWGAIWTDKPRYPKPLFYTYYQVTYKVTRMDFGVAGSIISLNIIPYQHTYSGIVAPSIEARERQDNQATSKCRIRSRQWPTSVLHLGNVSYSWFAHICSLIYNHQCWLLL